MCIYAYMCINALIYVFAPADDMITLEFLTARM